MTMLDQIVIEKWSIARKDSEKERNREREIAEKRTTRRQLPEKLISRGKEGAPAAWLSRTLPCSAGCRGVRKRRMAMVRRAAKAGETLFSKAILSLFRCGGERWWRRPKERAKGRISRTKFPCEETRLRRDCPGRHCARSVRWDLIELDRLTGLINRPITLIDEVSARTFVFLRAIYSGCARGYPFIRLRTMAWLNS